ncbi:MAG: hypothetical protein M3Z06_02250, partial [Actinomycetota bacterium]|nr:hypothetical protein [Actinomycetota bacterium]
MTRSKPRPRSWPAVAAGAWKAKQFPPPIPPHFDAPPTDSVPSRLPIVIEALVASPRPARGRGRPGEAERDQREGHSGRAPAGNQSTTRRATS